MYPFLPSKIIKNVYIFRESKFTYLIMVINKLMYLRFWWGLVRLFSITSGHTNSLKIDVTIFTRNVTFRTWNTRVELQLYDLSNSSTLRTSITNNQIANNWIVHFKNLKSRKCFDVNFCSRRFKDNF